MSELQARVRAGLHSGFCLSGHEGIICTADFKPVCGLIAPLRWMRRKDGSGYGMEVAFGTRDGVVARMVFDNRDLDGRRVIARLADSGFSLLGAPTDFKQLLRAWPDLRVDLRADHAGWVETPLGEIYMRPDGTSFAEVRCAASQAILVNPRPAQKAGTLTGWQEAVAGSALGNELLMFGICSTLSAPLLKLADLQTTMFHFYGQGPIGKSHLLAVAASTDRSPRLRQSWTVDSDRLEEQLAQSCDGMLDFDCLSENPSSQLLGRLTGLGDEAVSGGDMDLAGRAALDRRAPLGKSSRSKSQDRAGRDDVADHRYHCQYRSTRSFANAAWTRRWRRLPRHDAASYEGASWTSDACLHRRDQSGSFRHHRHPPAADRDNHRGHSGPGRTSG